MTPAPPAVELQGVAVVYRGILALDDVDLTVNRGRVCGLVGLNGAGKSTLLKAVAGIVPPSQGRVRVLGGSPAAAGRRSRIAYVPQSEAIDWHFPVSVADVVLMGRYGRMGWRRRPSDEDHARVRQALHQVHLADLADRQIGQLSGGQRKRAFVARALAQDAEVLLLDEPFAGVDQSSEESLTHVLRGVAAAGSTVLVATHDLTGLPALCDEAALIQRTVLMHDRPEVVLRAEHLALAFGRRGGRP